MTDASRDIPSPIRRAVRQRCGFGCVICGLPLYEYEHLLGYAELARTRPPEDVHHAEEITLLCDRHHREKTSGLLPIDDVICANQDPFNLRAGVSKPYDLHYSGTDCEVVIGNNTFTWHAPSEGAFFAPLVIDGLPLIAFTLQDNHVLLQLVVFDEFNEPMLTIGENRLNYSTIPWDIEFVGRNLIVREAHRKILIDMVFDVPGRIEISRGRFLRNGVELIIAPDMVFLTNTGAGIRGNTAKGGSIGLGFGTDLPRLGCGFRVSRVPRYLNRKDLRSDARTRALMKQLRDSAEMGDVDLSSLGDDS